MPKTSGTIGQGELDRAAPFSERPQGDARRTVFPISWGRPITVPRRDSVRAGMGAGKQATR